MADVDQTDRPEQLTVTEGGTNFLHPLIVDATEAASAYRKRKSLNVETTVHPADKAEELKRGWSVLREGKRAVRLKRL